MHLNKCGKEGLSKQIATQIHRLVENNSKDTPIIPLKWKIEPSGGLQIPTGDVTHFLNTLETAIDQLYNNITNIILCGDFNINYLSDNKKKQTLNSLLTSYSLYSIIDFPARTNNTTSTTIDNIFINPLKPELNPICYLLALLGAHHFLHVSRIRVKLLTFR